jgi:flagellar L-ring protein precursor FlgH
VSRFGSVILVSFMLVGAAFGQSSSLYLAEPRSVRDDQGRLYNPHAQAMSYTAVALPEPRHFNVHDLITIIVREQSTSRSEGSLETEKSIDVQGEIAAFPRLRLPTLLEGQLDGSDFSNRINPAVDVTFDREFEGDGDYEREDEMITRITARVVDVKPNGTLALEARTYIAHDKETVTLTLTGYCRADDVTAANTVLSTQMFDLRVEKQTTGEIHDASRKGLLTQVLDFLFNF